MRALELDHTLSEAHAALGDVKRYYHWDWTGAEREFRLALDLDPSSFWPYQGLAFLMVYQGRHDEARTYQSRAQQLDPQPQDNNGRSRSTPISTSIQRSDSAMQDDAGDRPQRLLGL